MSNKVRVRTEESSFDLHSRPRSFVKQEEARLDKDISALLGKNSVARTSASAVSYDSIMGLESEGEEDEVNDLLAKE